MHIQDNFNNIKELHKNDGGLAQLG